MEKNRNKLITSLSWSILTLVSLSSASCSVLEMAALTSRSFSTFNRLSSSDNSPLCSSCNDVL